MRFVTVLRILAVITVPGLAAEQPSGNDPRGEFYRLSRDLFEQAAPPEIRVLYAFPSREEWDFQVGRLERALAGGSLNELAALATEARPALGALRLVPGSEEIAEHALDWAEADEGRKYDVVTILQPTTPFVQPATIDACLEEVQVEGCMGCITGRPCSEPPAWLFRKDERGFAAPWLEGEVRGEREHSQFLEKLYIPTGAVYVNKVDVIRKQRTHIGRPLRFVMMERERAVDIDDEFDFVMAEALGSHHGFEITPLTRR